MAPDGCAISLGFVDSRGEPATIRLSVNQAGALIMTLPGLVSKALQTRFGDQTLRCAYPLDSWMIEQSTDPKDGRRLQRLLFDSARTAERTWRSAGGHVSREGDDTVDLAGQRPARFAWVVVVPTIYGTMPTQ